MHPCITIGCQLISPLSKYLKALVLTKKSFHTLGADEKFGHILEKCSELFVPARYFVPGHDLVARILVKVRCVRGALHLQVHQFFIYLFFQFSLIKTFGVIGGSRVRLSKPSQSKPCNKILKNRAIIEIQLYFYNGEVKCLFSRQRDF